jgi:tripartite-type tricarboxylate transporter receptor subunit TctC
VATATPYIKAGSVRAMGVTSRERFPMLPDVPALAEQGLADFDMVNWTALYAPKGTPAPALAELRRWLVAAVSDPEFKSALQRIGSSPVTPDRAAPGALESFLKGEIGRWSDVLKNVKVPAH